MATTATVVVAYVVALVVVAVVVVVRRRLPPRDADPLVVVGIVIAGTGAALMEAAGAQMVPMARLWDRVDRSGRLDKSQQGTSPVATTWTEIDSSVPGHGLPRGALARRDFATRLTAP